MNCARSQKEGLIAFLAVDLIAFRCIVRRPSVSVVGLWIGLLWIRSREYLVTGRLGLFIVDNYRF